MDQAALTNDELADILHIDKQRPAVIVYEMPPAPPPVPFANSMASAPLAEDRQEKKVFGSPDMLRSYEAILPYLADWAGMKVVLVNGRDLPAPLQDEARELKKQFRSWFEKTSSPLGGEEKKIIAEFQSKRRDISVQGDLDWAVLFKEMTGQALSPHYMRWEWDFMLGNGPYARRIEDEQGTPYCLIHTFADDMTPEDIFGVLTTLETKYYAGKKVPGDAASWRNLIAAHEVAHCVQESGSTNIREKRPDWQKEDPERGARIFWPEGMLAAEIEADRSSIELFNALAAADLRMDKSVINALMAGRALSSLLYHGKNEDLAAIANDHATNPGLPYAGQPPVWQGDTLDFASMQDLLVQLDEVSVASTLLIAQALAPEPGEVVNFQAMRCGLGVRTLTYCATRAFQMDGDAVLTYSYDRLRYGHARAEERPELRYAALRVLHESGYFAGNAVQNAYAAQFVEAAARYAPGLIVDADSAHLRAVLVTNPGLLAAIRAETPYAASANRFDCRNGRATPQAPCR